MLAKLKERRQGGNVPEPEQDLTLMPSKLQQPTKIHEITSRQASIDPAKSRVSSNSHY